VFTKIYAPESKMCSSLHMKLKYTTHDVYVSSSSLSRLIQCSSCKKTMEEGVTNMKMEVIVQCSGSSLKARVSVGILLKARVSVGISLKARVSVGINQGQIQCRYLTQGQSQCRYQSRPESV